MIQGGIRMSAPFISSSLPPTSVVSQPAPSFYAWYVLALLWAVALLRFVDLQIVAVLLEPIKAEFLLSDTQLALLGGLAFALFYGVLGLPVAWLADRWSRRTIIAVAVSLWSLMTALCGFAGSFTTLFLARIGVGIGEAGGYPPTSSLLADYFRPEQRSRVYAILASAIPVGVFTGFLVGGIVSQWWGWRTALQVVGVPGIVLGLLVLLTVREPLRGRFDATVASTTALPFLVSVRSLWQLHAYRKVVAGACLYTLGAYGSGVWIPSYFIRHHGFSVSEIGIMMALLYGGGGLLGTLAGGWVAERLGKRHGALQGHARLCQWSLLATLPLVPLVYLSPSAPLALALQTGVIVLMHMNIGPVLMLIQGLAGPARRAVAHALSVLVSNVVALPLGPLLVGWFSDNLGAHFGSQTLGIGIMLLLLAAWSCAGWCFRQANTALGHSQQS
jgi:predicted MFS family arabinose efflux permease